MGWKIKLPDPWVGGPWIDAKSGERPGKYELIQIITVEQGPDAIYGQWAMAYIEPQRDDYYLGVNVYYDHEEPGYAYEGRCSYCDDEIIKWRRIFNKEGDPTHFCVAGCGWSGPAEATYHCQRDGDGPYCPDCVIPNPDGEGHIWKGWPEKDRREVERKKEWEEYRATHPEPQPTGERVDVKEFETVACPTVSYADLKKRVGKPMPWWYPRRWYWKARFFRMSLPWKWEAVKRWWKRFRKSFRLDIHHDPRTCTVCHAQVFLVYDKDYFNCVGCGRSWKANGAPRFSKKHIKEHSHG